MLIWVEFKELGDMRISCDPQRFGPSLIRAFVLVANTTIGPDSKLHLTAIPCSKAAYLE